MKIKTTTRERERNSIFFLFGLVSQYVSRYSFFCRVLITDQCPSATSQIFGKSSLIFHNHFLLENLLVFTGFQILTNDQVEVAVKLLVKQMNKLL